MPSSTSTRGYGAEMTNALGTKIIGPTFGDEIAAAGLAGLPFTWGSDGDIQYDASMTTEQVASVWAVFAVHDPTKPAVIVQSVTADELTTALLTKGVLSKADLDSVSAASVKTGA